MKLHLIPLKTFLRELITTLSSNQLRCVRVKYSSHCRFKRMEPEEEGGVVFLEKTQTSKDISGKEIQIFPEIKVVNV